MGVVEPWQPFVSVQPRMSFDAIAPHYRWLERVTAGSLMQRCRTLFIHEIKTARNTLLLGEGRGRFLFELLRSNPNARVTCVDSSVRMLELMQTGLQNRRLPKGDRERRRPRRRGASGPGVWHSLSGSSSAARIRFVHADVLDGPWDSDAHSYDAVVSHFFLDCFPPDQLQTIISKVASITAPGGQWLLSDFCVPERGWQRFRAQIVLLGLYAFFRVFTRLPAKRLTAPDRCLQMAGFQLRCRQHFNHGLLHSDLWEKL